MQRMSACITNTFKRFFDPNASTIKEAIARNDYIENECWVNALVEHYKDCARKISINTRKDIRRFEDE